MLQDNFILTSMHQTILATPSSCFFSSSAQSSFFLHQHFLSKARFRSTNWSTARAFSLFFIPPLFPFVFSLVLDFTYLFIYYFLYSQNIPPFRTPYSHPVVVVMTDWVSGRQPDCAQLRPHPLPHRMRNGAEQGVESGYRKVSSAV